MGTIKLYLSYYCYIHNCVSHSSSLCALFIEPMVGKAWTKGLEENSRILGTANMFILLDWHSNCSSRHAVFSSLVVDPVDTTIMHLHHYKAARRPFSGGAYICLQNKVARGQENTSHVPHSDSDGHTQCY